MTTSRDDVGGNHLEVRAWTPRARPVRLPYPSLGTLFLGRAAVLSRIHDALRRGGRFGTTLSAQSIVGMGGIGKTRAAVEYAWAHQDEYAAVLFVAADSREALDTNLATLTGPLHLPEHTQAGQLVRSNAVLGWLKANPGWLLILDNVDTDVAVKAAGKLLSSLAGGHVLLTSRQRGFSLAVETIELDTQIGRAHV